ncbi:MAG: hypothetical protein VKK04_08380 [Synechococcales bacterium]|nr:hypothetical protein [Synechococcales bacterium]
MRIELCGSAQGEFYYPAIAREGRSPPTANLRNVQSLTPILTLPSCDRQQVVVSV